MASYSVFPKKEVTNMCECCEPKKEKECCEPKKEKECCPEEKKEEKCGQGKKSCCE